MMDGFPRPCHRVRGPALPTDSDVDQFPNFAGWNSARETLSCCRISAHLKFAGAAPISTSKRRMCTSRNRENP